jgi:hypothetical protein
MSTLYWVTRMLVLNLSLLNRVWSNNWFQDFCSNHFYVQSPYNFLTKISSEYFTRFLKGMLVSFSVRWAAWLVTSLVLAFYFSAYTTPTLNWGRLSASDCLRNISVTCKESYINTEFLWRHIISKRLYWRRYITEHWGSLACIYLGIDISPSWSYGFFLGNRRTSKLIFQFYSKAPSDKLKHICTIV